MPEEDDPKKKFWQKRNPFFEMFSEFDQMDEMMDEMMKKAFGDMESLKARGKPLVYGFSMKIGPDGKPKIRQFGDMQPTEGKIEVKDLREPLVDVIEHEKEIDVLAELPGVEKENIDIHAAEDRLTIKVPEKFHKQIVLPAKVKEGTVKAHYKNGVLTVTLKKQNASAPGKRVEVE